MVDVPSGHPLGQHAFDCLQARLTRCEVATQCVCNLHTNFLIFAFNEQRVRQQKAPTETNVFISFFGLIQSRREAK